MVAAPAVGRAQRAIAGQQGFPTGATQIPEEAALIARAQTATNRGQGDQALILLERYKSRYQRGALAEEHGAALVYALCAAGKRDAARSAAARFLLRFPRSPQAAGVRGACLGEGVRP